MCAPVLALSPEYAVSLKSRLIASSRARDASERSAIFTGCGRIR